LWNVEAKDKQDVITINADIDSISLLIIDLTPIRISMIVW